jgi:beta-xylosidase
MGSPKSLTGEELSKLQGLTRDVPESVKKVKAGKDGVVEVGFPMRSNDVVLVTVRR